MEKLHNATTWLTTAAVLTLVVALWWEPDFLAGGAPPRIWAAFNALWPVLIGAAVVTWVAEQAVAELTKERV